MKCKCGHKMIVIESRPLDDGRIYRRRHCFACGQEAIGLEKISYTAKRPHPIAFGRIYGVRPEQKSLDL